MFFARGTGFFALPTGIPALFFAVAVYLLKQVAEDANERAGQRGEHHQQGNRSPQRAVSRQTGLKAGRDQSHASGDQREEG